MSPRVYSVRRQRLALSGIRLFLATLGFVGSVAAGTDGAAAGVGVALGAGVSCLALVTDRRWLLLRRPTAEPLPPGARVTALTRAVAEGLLPSTVGVALLTGIALAFRPLLGAVLAGILAGMGIVSLISVLELALWERREHTVLFGDVDVHTRRYVAPAQHADDTAAAAASGT